MIENNYDAFCSQVEQLMQKKDITLNDLQKCLSLLTRTSIDIPLLARAFLHFSFKSPNKRKQFLLPSLTAWKKREKRTLESLPEKPMALCNKLFALLFPSAEKTFYIARAEEKVKTEQDVRSNIRLLIIQAALFKDIVLQLEGVSITPSTDLIPIENEIKKRKGEIADIEQKARAVKDAKQNMSSAIPPLFIHVAQKNKQWNEAIQLLNSPFEVLLPATFSTKEAFTGWIDQQTGRIEAVAEAIFLFQKANDAEKELKHYLKEVQYYHEPLVACCKEAFVGYIEQALFQKGVDPFLLIKQQTEGMRCLDREIKKKYADLQRKAVPYIAEFMTPNLRQYQDLYKEAVHLVESTTEIPFQGILFLSENVQKQVLQRLDLFLTELEQKIENLVVLGHTRNKKIRELEQFQTEYGALLHGLTCYLDMQKQYADEMHALRALKINKEIFLKMKRADIDECVATRYSTYLRMKEESEQKIHRYKEMTQSLYQQCQDSTHTLKRRLPEIFAEESPYPDLLDSLARVHTTLKVNIQEKQKLFFNGKLTLDAFRVHLSNLAYDHDVRHLRNELESRTKRLRELRAASLLPIEPLQAAKRNFEIMQLTHKEPLYRKIVDTSHDCKKILEHLENRRELFKDSMTFESVSSTMKRLWLQVEERQQKAKELIAQCESIFTLHADPFQKRLFQLLNDLEEITLEKLGKRPNLYDFYEQKLKERSPKSHWEQLCLICDEIEQKFPYVKPISFFLLFTESSERKKCLQEACISLEHIQETVAFAKSMQYIKTFEEERVDDFLELFEHKQLLLENEYTPSECVASWKRYTAFMEKSCFQVQVEVFLDIGLLDQKALLDIEEDKLTQTLKNAVMRAKLHLEDPDQGTISLLRRLPGSKERDQLLQGFGAWILASQNDANDSRTWMERLRSFCNLFFQARVLLNEPSGNRSSLTAHILLAARSLVDALEQFIQKKRGRSELLHLVNPWIEECHMLQEWIEAWEVEHETKEIYEDYFQRICNAIEAIPGNSAHDFPLLHYKELFGSFLQRLSSVRSIITELQ